MENIQAVSNVEQGSRTYPIESARASGDLIPEEEAPVQIIGAHCDYSARMSCREHWFRLVWRDGAWTYFSGRLSAVGIRAAERHQTTKGDVWRGELVATHDRGKPVESIALIVADDGKGGHMVQLQFSRRRDGQLSITLPNGVQMVLPDPRAK